MILFRAHEAHSRSLFKAISWRALGSIDTFVLGWIFTGKPGVAGAIASTEIITKTILYPTPNAAAKALMPESYRENKVIFPPSDVMAKCEYGAFEGAEKASLYEEVITRVRAA